MKKLQKNWKKINEEENMENLETGVLLWGAFSFDIVCFISNIQSPYNLGIHKL